MFILFSDEGITDLGVGKTDAPVCQGDDYFAGPIAIMADRVLELSLGYSALEIGSCGYVSEHQLSNRAVELKAAKKALGLPGKKRGKETRYFFNNARALSRIAKEHEVKYKDVVVAVLCRDADGTASAGRGLWSEKHQSMLDGFKEENYSRGVPMIPKPKSEAWLICAMKKTAYQNCGKLEARSGNDHSPRPLKAEFEKILGGKVTPQLLVDKARAIEIGRINMSSFRSFRERFEEVLR